MRNHYEYEVGHFEGAVEIPSDTFRDQLPQAAELLKDHKDKTGHHVLHGWHPLRKSKCLSACIVDFKKFFIWKVVLSTMPIRSGNRDLKINSTVKILYSTNALVNPSRERSLHIATSVANPPIHIPIVIIVPAISSLFNVPPAPRNMMAVAVKPAWRFIICLKKNKNFYGREKRMIRRFLIKPGRRLRPKVKASVASVQE